MMFSPRTAAAVTFSFSTVQEEQEPARLSHTWAVCLCLFQALGKRSSGQTMASVSSGTRLSEGERSSEGDSSPGKGEYCSQETESPLEMQMNWLEEDVTPDFSVWMEGLVPDSDTDSAPLDAGRRIHWLLFVFALRGQLSYPWCWEQLCRKTLNIKEHLKALATPPGAVIRH